MLDKYRTEHFDRVFRATVNLYLDPQSICHKCHAVHGGFNCMFCYCPLFEDTDCGGNYFILDNGIKDCSACILPHTPWFVKEQLLKLYKN